MDGWFNGAPDSYDGSSPGNSYDDLLLSTDFYVVVECRPNADRQESAELFHSCNVSSDNCIVAAGKHQPITSIQ